MLVKTWAVALVVVLALFASLSISSATAAPGGTTGAQITFDHSGVWVGETYRVEGSGFKPNAWVTVGAHYADTTWWNSGWTDADGNFSLAFTATSPGEVYHEAKERGTGGRYRLRAEAMLMTYASS